MKKTLALISFLLLSFVYSGIAQQDTIRNIILMIPDGTSSSVLSLSRWYKTYTSGAMASLAVDPWLCGLVKSHSSDAPIGDSAPTTSCYLTGHPTRTGYNSTYPPKTAQDLVPVNPDRTYQPLMTLPEASRIVYGKSLGLVFTSHITDATPADCAAHSYNRSNYAIISKQLVNNQIDVVIGGGIKRLNSYYYDLRKSGYEVVIDDMQQLRNSENPKLWALFGEYSMPYNIDRDTSKVPSLAEMTDIAINKLAQNPKGFFLMVEGSKIDWAAHDNDAKTVADEFLAFDEAVRVAIDFARKDGHTLVMILPDHGNSGITIGNRNSNKDYDELSLQQIMEPLARIKMSASQMTEILKNGSFDAIDSLFEQNFGIKLTKSQRKEILAAVQRDKMKNYSSESNKTKLSTEKTITKILYEQSYIGFTTYGHTGEDLFLAVYHPAGKIPVGLMTNVEINRYLSRQFNLENKLDSLTDEYFVPHLTLFPEASEVQIDSFGRNAIVLKMKVKEQQIEVESYNRVVRVNGKNVGLESVPVYVDRNKTFYLPKSLRRFIESL